MAYDSSNLTAFAYGNGATLWHYTSTDSAATINTAGYFNDAADRMRVNDIILSVSATGGTPVVTITYCNANDGSTVDIVDGSVMSATDTD